MKEFDFRIHMFADSCKINAEALRTVKVKITGSFIRWQCKLNWIYQRTHLKNGILANKDKTKLSMWYPTIHFQIGHKLFTTSRTRKHFVHGEKEFLLFMVTIISSIKYDTHGNWHS